MLSASSPRCRDEEHELLQIHKTKTLRLLENFYVILGRGPHWTIGSLCSNARLQHLHERFIVWRHEDRTKSRQQQRSRDWWRCRSKFWSRQVGVGRNRYSARVVSAVRFTCCKTVVPLFTPLIMFTFQFHWIVWKSLTFLAMIHSRKFLREVFPWHLNSVFFLFRCLSLLSTGHCCAAHCPLLSPKIKKPVGSIVCVFSCVFSALFDSQAWLTFRRACFRHPIIRRLHSWFPSVAAIQTCECGHALSLDHCYSWFSISWETQLPYSEPVSPDHAIHFNSTDDVYVEFREVMQTSRQDETFIRVSGKLELHGMVYLW